MKRVIAFVLTFCMLCALSGCGSSDGSTSSTSLNDSSDQTTAQDELTCSYDEFYASFLTRMEPLADQYSIAETHTFETADGNTCHCILISSLTSDDIYDLTVERTQSGNVVAVFLFEDRHSYGNLQFSVFALYCYESFGFPEIDADMFYEQYNLFSQNDILELETVSGWTIIVSADDNLISFSINPSIELDQCLIS